MQEPDTGIDPQTSPVRTRRAWRLPLVVLLVLGAAWASGLGDHLSLSTVIRHHEALSGFVAGHLMAGLLLYALIYVVSVALSFPGASLLTLAGGFLFGWAVAGIITVLSATAGATLVFLIARSSFGAIFRRRAGGLMDRMRKGFAEDAFSYLLFLRLTPLFPFWLVNVAPALLHVSLRIYVLATLIGIIPGTVAFAILGAGLGGLIAAQEAASPGCAAAGSCNIDVSALVTPGLLAALFALGVLALVPVAVKKWRARSSRQTLRTRS